MHRWPLNLLGLSLMAAAILPVPAALGEGPELTRQDHPWARFNPGSWRKVRVTTETLDRQGNVTGATTTETTTLLEDVTDDTYSLQVDVCVEVAGKRFETQPHSVQRGFIRELTGQSVVVSPSAAATIQIDGRRIACQTLNFETTQDGRRETSLVYLAENFRPRVLKKEVTSQDASASASTTHETSEEVVAVDMPFKLRSGIVSTWLVNVVRKNAKGTTTTLEAHCRDIPGEVVAHSSKELDSEGRLVRRSTLELVANGTNPDQDNGLSRRQMKRQQKGKR